MNARIANEEHALRDLLQKLKILPRSSPPLGDALRALEHAWFWYRPYRRYDTPGGLFRISFIEPVELLTKRPAVHLHVEKGPFARLTSDSSYTGRWIAEYQFKPNILIETSRGTVRRTV